jgi:hypothetical protein
LLGLFIFLFLELAVAGHASSSTQLKGSLQETLLNDFGSKDYGGLVLLDADLDDWDLEFALEEFLEVVLMDVLRHLVQYDGMLGLLSIKELVILHSQQHVFILVRCLGILVIECTTNASLQDQLSIWIVFSELNLRIERGRMYVHSNESMSDLFSQCGDLTQNVDV